MIRSSGTRPLLFPLVLFLTCWLFGGVALAQEAGTGSIVGVVRASATGLGIAGATVSIPGQSDNTDADGTYSLVGLAAGTYTVTVAVTNYGPQTKTVTVPANASAGANFLFGGLTKPEMTSVQQVIWAAYGNQAGSAGSLHDGNAAVVDIILRDTTNANTRGALKALKDITRRAQYELSLALSDLLGAQTQPAGQPRSYYVNRAKTQIQTTKTSTFPAIINAANAVKAAGAPGVYPATIDRYLSINVAGAQAKLNAFNAALGYADPYPPSRSKTGRITIIGPHGDYVRAQNWLTVAFDRMNRLETQAVIGYGADSLLPSYNNTYQRFKFIKLLTQKLGVTAGTITGMQFSGYSADPFFRTLSIMENLLHGGGGPVTAENDCFPDFCHAMSYDFNNISLWTFEDYRLGYWTGRPGYMGAMLNIFREITESWQGSDSATWYFMKFPECEKTGGCGGTGTP